MKALIHADLFDYESFKKNYYVLFDSKIIETGPMEQFAGADEIVDCKGCMVIPGLVVGHAHIYSAFARGWNTPFHPQDFRQLLEQMWWKLDKGLDREAVYYSGLVSGMEYIKNGVTTVIDHHASGRDILGTLEKLRQSICDEMGLRGIFCFESSDRFPIDECIQENVAFAKNATNQHAGLFGLHASMTLSEESLRKIAKESGQIPIHIHVAESMEDEQDSQKRYGKTVVERLEHFGLLRRNSILAHCIHVNEKEMDIMSRNQVVVALNPTSNMNNGVGLPDYKALRGKGLQCILGNDGLGFNITREMMNFVYGMHHRYQDPLGASLQDIRQLIRNTYDYAGKILGCCLGKMEVGYEADFISVPYTAPTDINEENALGHFFYGLLDGFHPRDVWCRGIARKKDYKIDAQESLICEQAGQIASSVWNRIGG